MLTGSIVLSIRILLSTLYLRGSLTITIYSFMNWAYLCFGADVCAMMTGHDFCNCGSRE